MDIEQFVDVKVDVVVSQTFALPDIYAGMNAILDFTSARERTLSKSS